MSGIVPLPVITSPPSANAGCVAGPEQVSAGCAIGTGEESHADAPLQAAGDRAGCPAPTQADDTEAQATPPQSLREFERALRGLGFTRLQATHIARQGFSGATASAAPDPEPKTAESELLRHAMERLARTLKDH